MKALENITEVPGEGLWDIVESGTSSDQTFKIFGWWVKVDITIRKKPSSFSARKKNTKLDILKISFIRGLREGPKT